MDNIDENTAEMEKEEYADSVRAAITREYVRNVVLAKPNQQITLEVGKDNKQQLTFAYTEATAPKTELAIAGSVRLHPREVKDKETETKTVLKSHLQSVDEAIWFDFCCGFLKMATTSLGTERLTTEKATSQGIEPGHIIKDGNFLIGVLSYNELGACVFGRYWDMENGRLKHGYANILREEFNRFWYMVEKGIEPPIHLSIKKGNDVATTDRSLIHIAGRTSINFGPTMFEIWTRTNMIHFAVTEGRLAIKDTRYLEFESALYATLTIGRAVYREALVRAYGKTRKTADGKIVKYFEKGKVHLPSALAAMRLLQLIEAKLQNQSIDGMSIKEVYPDWVKDDPDCRAVSMSVETLTTVFTRATKNGRPDWKAIEYAAGCACALYEYGLKTTGKIPSTGWRPRFVSVDNEQLVVTLYKWGGEGFFQIIDQPQLELLVSTDYKLNVDDNTSMEDIITEDNIGTLDDNTLQPKAEQPAPKLPRPLSKTSKVGEKAKRKAQAQGLADEGYTRAQIAEVLGVSEPTVKRMGLTYKKG